MFWDIIPWVLSVLTLVTMVMAGNKDIRAWYIGLFAQFIWVAFDIHFAAWGLLPLSFALFYVYVRNIWKWSGWVMESFWTGRTFNWYVGKQIGRAHV